MIILTVPLKLETMETPMGSVQNYVPDFFGVPVKSWGKCAEAANEGFMNVWVDCTPEAEMLLKAKQGIVYEAKIEKNPGDKDLQEVCKTALE